MVEHTSTALRPDPQSGAQSTRESGSESPCRLHPAASHHGRPWHCFDAPLANDGYRWWYVDALSEDGRSGLTLIAMLGSVFSPYYAAARRRGSASPLDHCALNVALYGAPARWALTERGRRHLERSADGLRFGPSNVQWDGEQLTFEIHERSAPLGRRVEGRVRVVPRLITDTLVELSPAGHHYWWPIAPLSDVEVEFTHPRLRWSGTGYLDSNFGDASLETHFRRWDWCRADLSRDQSVIQYNVERRDGSASVLALRVGADGALSREVALPATEAGKGIWGVARPTRADAGTRPRVHHVFEDTPFYTRSVLEGTWYGHTVHAVHESLDLDRFDARWVQALIPFRNPRRR